MVLAGLHTLAGFAVWALGLHAHLYPWMLRQSVPAEVDPSGLAWFLIAALPLLAFGWLLHWGVRASGTFPPWGFFAVAATAMIALGAIFPLSGFWLGAALCGWLAVGARRAHG